MVNGKPLPMTAYSPVSMRRRELALKQTERFFEHGLSAYFVTIPSIVLTDWAYFSDTPFWKGDRVSSQPLAPASGSIDEQAEHVLKGDPGAWIIVRFGTHEPKTWRDLHPDQQVVTETGEALPVPSLASDLYWRQAARYAAAVVAHCETRAWMSRIIGYAHFGRMEGTHEPLCQHSLFDHSAPMRRRFGRPIPKDKLRGATPDVAGQLYWQGAEENRDLRDYLQLTSRLYHDGFKRIAAAMAAELKKRGRTRFIVHDALKQPMQGWDNTGFFDAKEPWPLAYPELMAGSGHIGVAPLFDAPGMDGLITPHDYQARGIGGVYQPEGAADTAVLRGKLMLCEMDTRSYTGTDINFPARDDAEFAAITWRNIADSLTRAYPSYWMDVYQDWFASEGIHRVIARQAQVLREAAAWPHADVPGIAMIIDDEAVLETNGDGRFLQEAVMTEWKTGLSRCGVPFRIYLFDDLRRGDFPEHRLFYFPNLFRADPDRLSVLKKKVFRDGRVVVWGPGSGISDGKNIGTESAARLTGFDFDWIPVNMSRRTLIDNFDHPVTRGLPADTLIGSPLAYGPLLFPKDGVRLGQAWTKGGRLEAGLAIKEMAGWQSVFSAAVPLPASLWRNLARLAGAHVYCDSNDVLMADKGLVALHSAQVGRKRIELPGAFDVTDVVSGKPVGRRLKRIEFTLTAPATRVFRLGNS
jgi:hypothetical protein